MPIKLTKESAKEISKVLATATKSKARGGLFAELKKRKESKEKGGK